MNGRILILGAGGMLGHKLIDVLSPKFDVFGINHYGSGLMIDTIRTLKPTFVINATGFVKQRPGFDRNLDLAIDINSMFPHALSRICGSLDIRLIQFSSDCVFSGKTGNYTEGDKPDPEDKYGLMKLLGEVEGNNVITLRTSFIGWEIGNFNGLLSWFAKQRSKQIHGYRMAIYSGFSTSVIASLVVDIMENHADLHGIYHVSNLPISKFELLSTLRDLLKWDIEIVPDDSLICDRSLNADRFNSAMDWTPPSWDNVLSGLAEEWPRYKEYYYGLK